MWVEPDELLDADDTLVFTRLAGALHPDRSPAAEPSAAELDDLRLMVAARFDRSVAAPAPGGVSRTRSSRRRARRVGALAVLFLAGSASAAAATGVGLPLPGPVRAVAYAIGLPVDSPALDATHRHIRALEQALETGDVEYAREAILRIEHSLTDVPEDEREQAESEVGTALVSARSLLDEALLGTDDNEASRAPEAPPGPAVPRSGEAQADPAAMAPRSSPSPAAPRSSPVQPAPEPEPAPEPAPAEAAPRHAPEPAVPFEDEPSQDEPSQDETSQDETSDPVKPEEPMAGEDDATGATANHTLTDGSSPTASEPAPAPAPLEDAGDTALADPYAPERASTSSSWSIPSHQYTA